MGKMVCPTCGQSYSDELLYCLSDGTALAPEIDDETETVANPRIVIDPFADVSHEYCPSCGSPNKVGSRFCKKCGQPLTENAPVVVPPPPPPLYETVPVEPSEYPVVPVEKRSRAGLIAVIFGVAGLFLILLIIGVIAYNWNSATSPANGNATPTPTATPKPKTPTPTPTPDQTNINAETTSRIGKTGTLTTDANLRAEPDPNSDKVGVHYKGAKVKIVEVAEVPNDEGTTSVWYHVVVTSYGRSADAKNSGLDKDPGSADEGWINSNPKIYDAAKKAQVHKRTVDFDQP